MSLLGFFDPLMPKRYDAAAPHFTKLSRTLGLLWSYKLLWNTNQYILK